MVQINAPSLPLSKARMRSSKESVVDHSARLDEGRTPHITSEMKQISARVFQRAFSKVADELQQGQTITITKRGKPLGFFTKAPASASVPMPDFAANLAGMPYAPKGAQRIVREVMDEPVS